MKALLLLLQGNTKTSTFGKRSQENATPQGRLSFCSGAAASSFPSPRIILPTHRALCICHVDLEKPQARTLARSAKGQLK